MQNILTTDRLYLRPFQVIDALGLYQLNTRPEVLVHTGDVPFVDVAAARDFILTYDHYEHYGYGRWAVLEQASGRFIGFCGLKYHPIKGDTDLGYRINYAYWGKGYATEAARACLHYGLHDLAIARIIGRVRQANIASINVLEKIGMQREGTFDFEGFPGYLYVGMI
ncbi:MAG: N-acetyltransferase [Bacteroidetes bacterium]|nr:MAG: N-acetyltransferase [Bacteroidota bacterium]